MENLYWRVADLPAAEFKVPDDIFDLVFSVRGERLELDHAAALAEALRARLDAATCRRIGVHGIHLAGSGNGWNRPEQGDAEIPLPRRARLAIRLHRDDYDEVAAICDQSLQLGRQRLQLGACSIRKLSSQGSLHARAVGCDRHQPEPEFLAQAAAELRGLGIEVARMICGRSGEIRTAEGKLFTRALLVADLKPAESVRLQQHGLGAGRMLGCGLFVAHRGIDPVYTAQE